MQGTEGRAQANAHTVATGIPRLSRTVSAVRKVAGTCEWHIFLGARQKAANGPLPHYPFYERKLVMSTFGRRNLKVVFANFADVRSTNTSH